MSAAAVVAYVLFLLFVVARLFRGRTEGAADYIVAGRRLTLPAFTATLVTTWYGGILGVGEYTWRYGVSNWLVFGVPYYLYAGVFALWLAGRARRADVMTVPDMLERRYGRPAALVGAAVMFVMTAPAAYVLMLGVMVQVATGWPLWVGVAVGTALSVGYVFRGGLRAVVMTDMVQFVLMFTGFLVLVPVCVREFGGLDFLKASVPADHFRWDGGLGAQAVGVWYVLAMATLVEPAFYQRCYAARTESVAKRGIAAAIGFWIVFDFLTTTAGLYARAALPDLADPVQAFPALAAKVLPGFWHGGVTVGRLATISTTVDSYAFLAAITLGRDLVGRARGASEEVSLRYSRWALLAVAVLATVLAVAAGSVVSIWKMLGSVGTPVLLVPLAAAHTSKVQLRGRPVAVMMAVSGCVSLAWLALGRGGPWLGIEAVFPGVLVSLAALGFRVRNEED